MKKTVFSIILASLVLTACEKMQSPHHKEDIKDYGIIHTMDKLGFDILDRNLGATKPFNLDEAYNSPQECAAASGYYYQYGCNIPVANLVSVNNHFNKEYKKVKRDWSKPGKTPCPEGWRIPNLEEWQKIYDAFEITEGPYGEQMTDEGIAFYESLKLSNSSWWTIEGATEADREKNDPEMIWSDGSGSGDYGFSVLWSCTPVAGAESNSSRGFPQVYAFFDHADVKIEPHEINEAMPIRCIR